MKLIPARLDSPQSSPELTSFVSVPLICPEVPWPIYAQSFAPKQSWHSWDQLHADIWQGGHHLHVTGCLRLFWQSLAQKKTSKTQIKTILSQAHEAILITGLPLGSIWNYSNSNCSISWPLCEPALIGPKIHGFPIKKRCICKAWRVWSEWSPNLIHFASVSRQLLNKVLFNIALPRAFHDISFVLLEMKKCEDLNAAWRSCWGDGTLGCH